MWGRHKSDAEKWAELVDLTRYLLLGFRDEQTVGEVREFLKGERERFGAVGPAPDMDELKSKAAALTEIERLVDSFEAAWVWKIGRHIFSRAATSEELERASRTG